VSRCFLLRLRGRGFGEACSFSGERSFFVMVVIDRSYVGSGTVATWEQQKISFKLKTSNLANPDVCKNVVLKIMIKVCFKSVDFICWLLFSITLVVIVDGILNICCHIF
jgi:hypothetical protein